MDVSYHDSYLDLHRRQEEGERQREIFEAVNHQTHSLHKHTQAFMSCVNDTCPSGINIDCVLLSLGYDLVLMVLLLHGFLLMDRRRPTLSHGNSIDYFFPNSYLYVYFYYPNQGGPFFGVLTKTMKNDHISLVLSVLYR